ncbi:MAG: hypothetical protein H0Z19_07255 [Archaeoglobus sp.]|uniref:hypothetical protein n=1 Tax=Archaeoglobus sp. TaxID=1872626 RepID=UPI001DDDFF61|nr:hypothetical protein [Archaeoglobus sp.]MBO8180261.1 hypothetical protein [Archaeoglobus sp.]
MVDHTTSITENITLSEALPFNLSSILSDSLTLQESILNLQEILSKRYKPPIFRFYLDGEEKGIKSIRIRKDLNGVTEATLTAYVYAATEEDILKPVVITSTNPYDDTTITLFRGVLVKIEENKPDKEIKLECRGLDYYLENDIFIQYDSETGEINGVFEYMQERADNIARDILKDTSFTLIECPTTKISLKFDYENRLRALQLIAEILNRVLWIDNDYGVHIGDNSGRFELSEITSKRLSQSGEDTYNRIIVIGGNDGEGKVPIAIVEDGQLISQQGVKAKKFTIMQIRDKETALLFAKAYLDTYKQINYKLSVRIPPKWKNYLIDIGNVITIDSEEYIISSLELSDKEITLEATPIRSFINLKNYLERQIKQIETATSSSTFYNESPTLLTAYEILDLDTAYYGGSTPKTITIGDDTYTILSVMHFFIPDNFTPKEAELKLRWFGDESPISFKVIVNSDVCSPVSEGTTDDGDALYTVIVDSLKKGWNNIYFVQ